MQFIGKIQAKMDAKGRLFFPADFRRQLSGGEQRFVLRPDAHQPCLVIYPYAVWQAEVEVLRRELNPWRREEAMVLRHFLSDVELFELDANGRFLVPKRFLPLCGGSRSVCFVGMDDRIEVWDAERASSPFMSQEDFSAAVERLLGSREV